MTWPFENDTGAIVKRECITIHHCPLWFWGDTGNAEPQPKNSTDYVSCDF